MINDPSFPELKGFQSKFFVRLVPFLFVLALAYGVSVESFRSFDAHNPRFPAGDAGSYLRLAQGDQDVWITHRYRPVIPWLAREVSRILPKTAGLFSGPVLDEIDQLKRGFYIVNLVVMCAAALVFMQLLKVLKFGSSWTYVGVAIFLCSSVVSYSISCSLVDSGYYLGIAIVCLLTLQKRFLLLALAGPLFVILKEPLLLFLILPWVHAPRRKICYFIPVAGLVVLVLWRQMLINIWGPAATMGNEHAIVDFSNVVRTSLEHIVTSLQKFFRPQGIRELLQTFSVLLYLAPFGAFLSWRVKEFHVPLFLHMTVPIAIFYALLSTHIGRMLFAGFPALIVYILIVLRYSSSNHSTTANERESLSG